VEDSRISVRLTGVLSLVMAGERTEFSGGVGFET
jgi:hypothetical protein